MGSEFNLMSSGGGDTPGITISPLVRIIMQREHPSTVRFTPQQLILIHQEATTTGIPRNRVVRLAIDAYFSDRSASSPT